MGYVLHRGARTTVAVRRAIQPCQESVRAAAKRYGISPTTVQKWRRRERMSAYGKRHWRLDRLQVGHSVYSGKGWCSSEADH